MPSATWVDLSKWQGVISVAVFQQWRAAGIVGVILKLGGGNDGRYQDSVYATTSVNARAAGLQVQGYWFNGVTDPAGDAQFLLSYLAAGQFVWADIESEGTMPHWNDDQADAFCRVLEAAGHRTGAYMSQSVTKGSWPKMSKRPLWVAFYGPSSVNFSVGAWSAPALWQFSSSGQLPGYAGRLDVNEAQPGFASISSTPITQEDDVPNIYEIVAGPNDATHYLSINRAMRYPLSKQSEADYQYFMKNTLGYTDAQCAVKPVATLASFGPIVRDDTATAPAAAPTIDLDALAAKIAPLVAKSIVIPPVPTGPTTINLTGKLS